MSKSITHRDFNHGYVIACCNLLHSHNEDSLAADLLAEAGLSEADIEALNLDEYDARALKTIREAIHDDPIAR